MTCNALAPSRGSDPPRIEGNLNLRQRRRLSLSGPRKPGWQKPCWQIHAHWLHGCVGARTRVARARLRFQFTCDNSQVMRMCKCTGYAGMLVQVHRVHH